MAVSDFHEDMMTTFKAAGKGDTFIASNEGGGCDEAAITKIENNYIKDSLKKEENTDELASGPPDLMYSVEDNPPWYLCIILGFQHYLTAFGGTISSPLILHQYFCMDQDTVGLSELIGTTLFVCGLATLLQTTLGCRLPIVQGSSGAFLVPVIALMSVPERFCPYIKAREARNLRHADDDKWSLYVDNWSLCLLIVTQVSDLWAIGPLVCSALYPGAIRTIALIALFSQFFRSLNIPCLTYKRKEGCVKVGLPIFNLFPVLIAVLTAWCVCAILTAAGVFPMEENGWGYYARTDINTDVLQTSKWFRFPYPGQWGTPSVSTAGVLGMLSGVLASMVESVGDYYACARFSGAPPPPKNAVNRGIGMEGITCVLAGAWGSGNGTTSYSENIGAIGITKVGSRRVVQFGGAIMLILGCFGKFGALFATIPQPVLGGMFMVLFGMVTAAGLSNLQYVKLSSSRNMFILGLSLVFGLSFPIWIKGNDSISTGSNVLDQILTVLLSSNMFVGGAVGCVLDNTIPGTDDERGIRKWRHLETQQQTSSHVPSSRDVYDIPYITKALHRWPVCRFVPCCPTFMFGKKRTLHSEYSDTDV